MAIPIRHKKCGKIAMWYIGEKYDDRISSQNIVYLDGTRPSACSAIPRCPHCGGSLSPPMFAMKRCFYDRSMDKNDIKNDFLNYQTAIDMAE